MVKNKDSANSYGLMEESTEDNGEVANKMEEEYSSQKMELKE